MFPKFHGIQLALGGSIANAVVENLAVDPAPLGAGRIWYNTATKKLKFSSLDSGGAVIVEVVATGAEVAQVIADLAALGARVTAVEANYVKKDGSVAFTGNVDAGGNKLVNVANGTANSDAVNFGQLQSAIGSLANAFKYRGTVAGGNDAGTALDLEDQTNKGTGDYYKVATAGYFKVGSAGTPFFANQGDGLVFNDAAGVDVIDNTNSTVAGTTNFVTVTGSPDTGFTVDIAAAFKTRVSDVEAAVVAEAARAQAAESDLADDIVAEHDRAVAAEGVLTQAVSDEAARATAAEGVLDGKIATEKSRAEGVEAGIQTKIGDLSTLTTSDKTSVVNAINAVAAGGSAADGKIGDLSTLTTTDKSTVVAAINEVNAAVAAEKSRAEGVEAGLASDIAAEQARAEGAEATLTSDLAAEVTRAKGVEGNLASLTTDVKSSLQAAINEVDAHADAAAAAAASASSAVAAEQARAEGVEGGLRTDVDAATAAIAAETARATGVEGSLASLTTTAKGSLVAAINENKASVDTEKARALAAEAQVASDAADALAAEVSRAQGVEGNLASLSTTDKSSLVNAINEVAEAAGEGTGALKDAINGQRFKEVSASAALTHTFTHNLNSSFVQAQVWVKDDNDIFRNDIVAVEETSANVITVTLTEARIVKIVVQALDDLA